MSKSIPRRGPHASLPPVGKHQAVRPLLVMLAMAGCVHADEKPIKKELEFAKVGGVPLMLDLYLPTKADRPAPTMVWVHGGAWRAGSREDVPILGFVAKGYAVASVDYRLSTTAPFPAQVHDIKAAVRFLTAKAAEFNLDTNCFIMAGGSAGAHLASLVGVSNGVKELAGTVGEFGSASSDVHAIVSYFGASNLQTILGQSTPHGLKVRVPALELLLGGQPDQKAELARLASPVAHVDAADPPIFLIHGDQDPQMPINQSHELQGAYERVGRPVEFFVVHGGVHGGKGFYDAAMENRVDAFLRKQLRLSGDSR